MLSVNQITTLTPNEKEELISCALAEIAESITIRRREVRDKNREITTLLKQEKRLQALINIYTPVPDTLTLREVIAGLPLLPEDERYNIMDQLTRKVHNG